MIKRNDGDEASSWILTYTDCMTLLLCFFVLIYAAPKDAGSKEKKIGYLKKSRFGEEKVKGLMDVDSDSTFIDKKDRKTISTTDQNTPNVARQPPKKKVSQLMEHVQDRTTHEAIGHIVKVKPINSLSFNIQVPGSLLFKPGEASLKDQHIQILDKIRSILHEIDYAYMIVEGHTDIRRLMPGATFTSNWELSTARAARVVEFLSLYTKDKTKFLAEGRAFTKPKNTKDPFAPENRRVEIHIYVEKPQS